MRQALEEALMKERHGPGPLARLSSLAAPTADIDVMLAQIAAGRS
jgi:hypothetical protein